MSEVEALEARLTAAMDRIRNASQLGRQAIQDLEKKCAALAAERDGLHAQMAGMQSQLAEAQTPAPAAETDLLEAARGEAAQLAQGLADEKARVSTLEEQLAHVRAEVDAAAAQSVRAEGRIRLGAVRDSGANEDHLAKITQLESTIEQLKHANAQLRANNTALREAHAAGVPDAELINSGLEAEVDALRAARAADRAEIDSVLAALETLMKDPEPVKETQDA